MLVAGLLSIAATSVPILLSLLVAPWLVVEGASWPALDTPQFLSAIGQGRDGAWLWTDHFTAEAHAPAPVYPLYLALGRLDVLGGWSPATLYDAGSVVARVLLWVSAVVLVYRVVGRTYWRWILPLLIASGGNLVFIKLMALDAARSIGGDTFAPAMSLITLMAAAPHWIVGSAIFLFNVWLLCDIGDGHEIRRTLLLVCIGLTLSAVFPYLVPVALTLTVGAYALHFSQRRQFRLAAIGPLALAAGAAPVSLAVAASVWFDPFWRGVYGPPQNMMASPPVVLLPAYLGLIVVPAFVGAVRSWRHGESGQRVVTIALLSSVLWMYLPTSFQVRAGVAIQPLLAISAVHVYREWWARHRIVVAAFLAAGMVESAAFLVLLAASVMGYGPLPANGLARPEADLADWLAPQVSTQALVLAPPEFSRYLGSRIAGRVVFADAGSVTLDRAEKRALIARYFDPRTTLDERVQIEGQLGNPTWLVEPEELSVAPGTWTRRAAGGGLVVYARD